VSAQIGAPVRIVALVGLVAAMGVATWTFALGRNGGTHASSSAPEATPVVKDPVAIAKAVASKLDAHNRATAAGRPDTAQPSQPAQPTRTHAAVPAHTAAAAPARPARSAVQHRAVHHAAVRPKTKRATTLASALRHHHVVVVLLYDPQSRIDSYSVGETELGAANAHAGFLRVNVLDARESQPFATTYQSLQTPAVLFFTRGGKLVQKLTGFADHESVTQAATNAARGLVAAG
jgi:hypothetical protein